MVGFLYGAFLALLSLGAARGGHGTLIPLLLSSLALSIFYLAADSDPEPRGPLYLMLFGGPLLWATLSLLVVLSGRGRRPRLTQAPMLLHYASALALVAMTVGWFDVPAALMRAQELVVIWATIYLLGQVALWWRMGPRHGLRTNC